MQSKQIILSAVFLFLTVFHTSTATPVSALGATVEAPQSSTSAGESLLDTKDSSGDQTRAKNTNRRQKREEPDHTHALITDDHASTKETNEKSLATKIKEDLLAIETQEMNNNHNQ